MNRQSRQRLADSKVRIMVTADAQITNIQVYVERAPMAAALSGDVTGRVPLGVKMGTQVINKVGNNTTRQWGRRGKGDIVLLYIYLRMV